MTFDSSLLSSIDCSVFLSTKASTHKYLTFSDSFFRMDCRTSRVWMSAKRRLRAARIKISKAVFGTKVKMGPSIKASQRKNRGPCLMALCSPSFVPLQTWRNLGSTVPSSNSPNLSVWPIRRPDELSNVLDQMSIGDDLNGFPHLKHLYYEVYYANLEALTEEERNAFASQATDLAQAVPGLMSITNVDTQNLPYLTARIRRRENGEVADVEVGKGYGMKIGYDDEAFPWAPHDV